MSRVYIFRPKATRRQGRRFWSPRPQLSSCFFPLSLSRCLVMQPTCCCRVRPSLQADVAAVVSKWTGVPVEKAAAWFCVWYVAVKTIGVPAYSRRPHVPNCRFLALTLKVSSDEGARLVKLEEARRASNASCPRQVAAYAPGVASKSLWYGTGSPRPRDWAERGGTCRVSPGLSSLGAFVLRVATGTK